MKCVDRKQMKINCHIYLLWRIVKTQTGMQVQQKE